MRVIIMKKTYYWLDWLRFLAAAAVVIEHSRDLMFVKYSDLISSSHTICTIIFFTLSRFGNEAVLVFFVLSGFLVGGQAFERIIEGNFNLKNYAIDRITRIYIPLIPAIILTVTVESYLQNQIDWFQVISNVFSFQGVFTPELTGNNVLWTLAYEVWFYILIGGIALIYRKNAIGWCVIIIVALIFTKLYIHYLMCWLIGALAFFKRPTKLSYKAIILSLIIIIYGNFARQVRLGSESLDIHYLLMFTPGEAMARIIFSIGIALLIRQIILIQSWHGINRDYN
jgi:peptidoglycan/LPS O-acetylase OafA/YrhL